jgi:hypothetical protein
MNVCFRGISRHRTAAELGPLMTQSGHSCPPEQLVRRRPVITSPP